MEDSNIIEIRSNQLLLTLSQCRDYVTLDDVAILMIEYSLRTLSI